MGNFNSKHPALGKDQNSTKLMNAIIDQGLFCIANNNLTSIGFQGSSIIDYIIVS